MWTGTLSVEQRKIRELKKKKAKEKRVNKQSTKNDSMNTDTTTKEDSMNIDTAMDELTTNMSKLKLPQSISFGRRAKPTLYHYKSSDKDVEMKETKPKRKRGPKKKKDLFSSNTSDLNQ